MSCENTHKKMNISCFTACFEQNNKHLNVQASTFKPWNKHFGQTG